MSGRNQSAPPLPQDDPARLADMDRGLIDRRIYRDEGLYRRELAKIFARAWNFMAHESQIPEVGDYVVTWIGEDQVIVVRDAEGRVQVLANSCAHRGNALCRAELGNTRNFLCSYHGWTYDLDGTLIGIPGKKHFYRDKLDARQWGLRRAAKVEQYKGFYFATLDAGAPSLHDYLGEVGRIGMDQLTQHGELVAVEGVQKNIIDCNWKIAVDNLFDWYHVNISHRSASKIGFVNASVMQPMQQMVMLGDYGHAISGPMLSEAQQAEIDKLSDREREELDLLSLQERARLAPRISERRPLRSQAMREAMGPVGARAMGHPNIFPNLWISTRGLQLCLRLPRGVDQTEIWWFTFLPKKFSAEQRRQAMKYMQHSFGPAGLLEQDDGENWSQSTEAAHGHLAAQAPHNLQMALGQDEMREHPSGQKRIETRVNEHAQRWLYRNWAAWLSAEDWPQLSANRPPLPVGTV